MRFLPKFGFDDSFSAEEESAKADMKRKLKMYVNQENLKEASSLVFDIKDKLHRLESLGIDLESLNVLLNKPQKISNLVVTKDFKLLLPAYDLTIKMRPLPLTVYLFFLLHPEGVAFKYLSDYRSEITDIYLRVSRRHSLDSLDKSIDYLVDSTNNSINEKCSRIREAFCRHLDEQTASHYLITGSIAMLKYIPLNRNYVVFETELNSTEI